MGYQVYPQSATPGNETTPKRFLEGVAAEPISPAEIERQARLTRGAIDKLYSMDEVSQRARLQRQTGLDYFGNPLESSLKSSLKEEVRELALAS